MGEGDGATQVTVTAAFSNRSTYETATTVTVSVGGSGTATSGTDYAAVAGFAVTIAPGDASGAATFTLEPAQDNVIEGDETIGVAGRAAGLTVNGADLTLTDDDGAPSVDLSLSPSIVGEGAGATQVTVTAAFSNGNTYAADKQVTVSVGGGTATAGTDYASVSDFSVTIPAGQTSGAADFTLTPTDDTLVEGDETVGAAGTATGLTVNGAELTLTDDDGAPTVNLSAAPATAGEGDGATTVSVTAAFSTDVTFPDDTIVTVTVGGSGTAASGTDYASVSDFAVTILAGGTSGTANFTLTPTDDTLVEGDETVGVSGSAPGLTVNGTEITLTDDEVAAAASLSANLSLSPATAGEGDGATTVSVTATFSADITFPEDTTVTVSVGGVGSAASGTDYAPVSDFAVRIPAGGTSGTAEFTLTPTDDTLVEGDETVGVSGSAPGLIVNGAEITLTDNDGAPAVNLSAAPATAGEGDGAMAVSVTAAFSIGATYAADTTVTVSVGGGGTASSGTDYAPVSDFAVTIAAGQTSGTAGFTLTPTDDTLVEGDETIGVSGSAAGLTVNGAEITLTDDDAAPAVNLSAAPATAGEGDGATAVSVTAAFSTGATYAADTTVTVSVGGGGTASSGTDYAPVSDFDVTIAAGQTSGTAGFTLTPTDDTLVEGDETIGVSGSAAGLTVNGAEITLTDDDAAPAVNLSAAPATAGEGDGATAVSVTAAFSTGATYAADTTVTVSVGGGGTASSGTDYAPVSDFDVTIAAGQTSGTAGFTLTPTDDTWSRATRRSGCRAAAAGLTVNGAEITLTDDDAAPAVNLSAAPATAGEGDGATAVSVTAAFSTGATYAADTTVTVSVGGGGTASSGTDYAPVSDFDVTIAAGRTSGTAEFTLTPTDDTLVEGDETIGVAGTATGLTVNGAELTLTDDDTAPTLTLSVGPARGREGGEVVFNVTLSHAVEETVIVEYATADGTAAAGADYVATSGQLVFAPGETTHAVRVPVLNDQVVEDTETFTLTVRVVQPQGAAPTGTPAPVPASASGTILDGDTAAVTVSEPVVGEVDGEAVFRITLAPQYAFGITLLYAAVDGTAVAGTDYVATSGKLVFAPGETGLRRWPCRCWTTTVAERVETFTLVLDPDAASGLGRVTAEATIRDDDLAEQRAEEANRTLYLLARSIASEAVSAVGERFVNGGDASPQLTLGSVPTAGGGFGAAPGLGGGPGQLSVPWGAGFGAPGPGGAAGFGGAPGYGGAAGYGGATGFGFGGPVMPTDEAFADLAWLDNAQFALPLQFGADEGADEGPASGWRDWTVWGRAGTVRSQLQSESGAQTRGDVFTSHVGLETRPRPSVLVGAAVSHSVGKLGYTAERPGRRAAAWAASARATAA